MTGNLDLNPIDYVPQLKKKNVLLIHGSADDVVPVAHSKTLFTKLKGGRGNHKLIIIKGADHSNVMEFLTIPRIFRQVMWWLKRIDEVAK
jgi:dipeptidyl aminopeptidase/acylaminoacyl peptidase